MADTGFIGGTYVAASITQDTQECYNWYAEVDPTKQQGERGVIALYPTPGLLQQTQLSNVAEVRQVFTATGGNILLTVAGNTLYSVNAAFTATAVGSLNTSSGPVGITDNGTTAMIVDGANRYSYVYSTGAFAILADGAFTAANRCDVVDNFIIYNNPNTNKWGCTNASSIVSDALNVGAKDGAPDNLVTLIVNQRQVYLLGERTTEAWIDTGAFPFPFQRIPGTSAQTGVAAAFSLARLGGSFAWLGKDDRGQGIILQMNGYQPQRISTYAVETAINSYTTINDARAYSYQQNGHEFYVLNFPTADTTWVYDLSTQLWHKRAWRDNNNVLHRHRGNCACTFAGKVIVGDYQNGILYSYSLSNYTDNGATIPCIRRARHFTQDLRHVYYHDLQLQFQPGVGLQSGQGSDPQAMLRWSDDGGFTWSNEHWVSIGKVGKYKNRAIWRRLGESRDRIFEVQVSDPVFRALVSAEMNATVGAT